MGYKIGEKQLLNLWMAISCLNCSREINDPQMCSELLIQAQFHLTDLVLDLQLLPEVEAGSALPIADFDRIESFDA